MDMRTDLIAVPHASLRDPNPEKPGEGDQSSCRKRPTKGRTGRGPKRGKASSARKVKVQCKEKQRR